MIAMEAGSRVDGTDNYDDVNDSNYDNEAKICLQL